MMTVPESTAAANLRTYWEAFGFSVSVGIMMGLAVAVAGIILAVVSWRNKYRKRGGSSQDGSSKGVVKFFGGRITRNKVGVRIGKDSNVPMEFHDTDISDNKTDGVVTGKDRDEEEK